MSTAYIVAVRAYEREQLLERVSRQGATIGHSIPEEITLQETTVPLREFVFELRRRETYPRPEQERVDNAKRSLRRGRRDRLDRLESAAISYEEGERLATEIIGIDRALNALESLSPESIEAQAEKQAIADQRRWISFLRRALGEEQYSGGTTRDRDY